MLVKVLKSIWSNRLLHWLLLLLLLASLLLWLLLLLLRLLLLLLLLLERLLLLQLQFQWLLLPPWLPLLCLADP
jgi:hypothetical protein